MKSSYNNLCSKFIQILKTVPNNIAIEYKNSKVTYHEIAKLSFFFLKDLEDKKLKKNSSVIIFHDKSKWAYGLLIACNLRGIVYSIIDPSISKKRVTDIKGCLEPFVEYNFVNKKTKSDYENSNFYKKKYVSLDLKFLINEFEKYSKNVGLKSLCYIMFTSGSTGFPKGVPIEQGSVINFINWSKDRFQITDKSKLSGLNPMFFDNSIFDFYSSIYNGCTLIPITQDMIRNTKKVVEFLSDSNLTHWFSVPSFIIYCLKMKSFKKDRLNSVKYFIFGGEGFHKTTLLEFYNIYSNKSKFINVYGPTEATCICSSYEVSKQTFFDINHLCPIGYISPYHDFKILNDKRKGELILIGNQISPGYLNDSKKKEEKFKILKHNSEKYMRHYFTDDIVEIENDGLLKFKGRTDLQIKHMGYRIELEEIEFHITSNVKISQTCVVYNKKEENSFGEIIAFISLNNGVNKNFNHSILVENLPNYMKPSKYIFIDNMPLNNNGKIDRNKLIKRLSNDA